MSDGEQDYKAAVVRFVNKMILDALERSAGEIHFDASSGTLIVSFVVGSTSEEIARPPEDLTSRILNRVRVMSQTGIYGAGNPVEGQFKLRLSETQSVTFRVTNSADRIVVYNEGTDEPPFPGEDQV